jgi:hypothetical protein
MKGVRTARLACGFSAFHPADRVLESEPPPSEACHDFAGTPRDKHVYRVVRER